MTVSPSASPASATITPPSSTAPLALWLAVQLGVIVIAATRVPLAAKYPDAAERLAPELLFPAQLVVAALLFPWLLRGSVRALQVIGTALPFQLAAGYLTGVSVAQLAPSCGLVAVWLVSFAVWSAVLRSTGAQAI